MVQHIIVCLPTEREKLQEAWLPALDGRALTLALSIIPVLRGSG